MDFIHNKIVFLFHKPLTQVDGQTKYIKSLIDSLTTRYDVFIPSENYFMSNRKVIKFWIIRTLMVNIYLLKWILKNNRILNNEFTICIMEDRYIMIPTYLLLTKAHIKFISRVSDWGEDYISSLEYKHFFQLYLMRCLNSIYEKFVKEYSDCIIVPSEFLYTRIQMDYKKKIFVFLQPYQLLTKSKPTSTCMTNFIDKNHDIYCIFVGNYNYKPNADSADFIINVLINQLSKVDKKIKILLVGDAGMEKYSKYNSENLLVLGLVPDMSWIYDKCHIGLNPSLAIGGASIKNIEYLVNGMYVVTTPESSKGVIKTINSVVCDRKDFSHVICQLADKVRHNINPDKDEIEKIRRYYSKSIITSELMKFLESD